MKLKNKTVFITGGSSGIGQACAEKFGELGARILLCARRENKLKALASTLKQKYAVEVYVCSLDVSDPDAVKTALSRLPTEWQDIDILVNNAGLALGLDKIHEGDIQDWETMIDTNIKGVLYITRLVLQNMLQRNQGHIINIGSISSHEVYSGGVVYCATKFALKAISKGLKMDVHGTPIRVSSVDPGVVRTEFSTVRFGGDQKKFDTVYKGLTPLSAEDVAEVVVFCATRPAHVNIQEVRVNPTDQTSASMIHRRKE